MQSLSDILINDLLNKGIKTFFGLQGGAVARIIESVVKLGGKFHSVLNEQAAGYAAHGYFLATSKPAGLIFTTGPGLTNGVSGIAACYYDRVPLVVIIGQVVKSDNIAKETNTRMVGFQEVQHLDIIKPISDLNFKINSLKDYKKNRNKIFNNEFEKKVSIFEIPDDVQREKTSFLSKLKNFKKKEQFKISTKKKNLIKNYFKETKKIIFILGFGFVQSWKMKNSLSILKKNKLNICLTWGAQSIQKYKNFFTIGLFGNHSPGKANYALKTADLVISLGASLLQHQTLKIKKNFAKNAKIIFINSSFNECKRAKKQFGKRLEFINIDCHEFLKLKQVNKMLKNCSKKRFNTDNFVHNNLTPVKILKNFFKKINPDRSIIFSDAGATLSWSYQAVNLLKTCAPLYTSFNLHAMGYANCAGVGAAIEKKKEIYIIIGDGGLLMNSQELAWLKYYKVKIIVIDNKGYGIIRQTQREYYSSQFLASDFDDVNSNLPNYSVSKILKSFDIKYDIISSNNINQNIIDSFLQNKSTRAVIIKTNYLAEVETDN